MGAAGAGILFQDACGGGIQIAIHAIEAEAMDERDGTRGGLIAVLADLRQEKRGNRAMNDL